MVAWLELDLLMPSPVVAPALVWGLVTRGIALAFAVTFASLMREVVPIAGRDGIAPVRELHAAIRRDFPAPARWLYFPSLLWLSDDDRWLQALPCLGLVAALSVVVGGPHTPIALFVCWLALLSLDRAVVLVYPWDSLLLELGLWAVALPALAPLPALAARSAPDPLLVWLFRLALFRVMFGFGKQKFLGSTRSDAGFLRGFYVRQPLPTPLGWWAHHLPMAIHVLALAVMFVIEMILPFGVFWPGAPSVVFALATIGLMLAIQAVGNFGVFNLLTIALAVALLDDQTPAALDLGEAFALAQPPARLALHLAIAAHTFGALLLLPLNTWASFTWSLWPLWRRVRPRALTWPVAVFRALQPLRWLHAYGVFPPRSAPAVRMTPSLELSFDGATWIAADFRVWPTHERSAPRFVAPHHPRVDQAIVYEAAGFEESGPLRGLTGRWDPYGHARISGAGRLIAALLRNSPAAWQLLGPGEAAERARAAAPVAARAPLDMLAPTSPSERRRTGHWWQRSRVAAHLEPLRLGDPLLDTRPPPPERWAIDDLVWLERSRLGPLMRRAARGEDLHALVLAGGEGIGQADVDRLWRDLVPALADADLHGWTDLVAQVASVRARWDADERDRLERVVGRYVILFIARFEPRLTRGGVAAILGLREPPLPLDSHEQLARLARYAIVHGRACFDALLAEPERARELLADMSPRAGTYLRAVFELETLRHHARKQRMLAAQLRVRGRSEPSPRAQTLAAWAGQVARRLWPSFARMDLLRELPADLLAAPPHPSDPLGEPIPERWPSFVLDGLALHLDPDPTQEPDP